MSSTLIELDDIVRDHGAPPVRAVDHISLRIDRGELMAIVGPSGSGKSSLLNIMGLLDRPTSGSVRIEGVDIATLSDRQLSGLRASTLGFVFQQFHLDETLTALDNVANGALYSGVPRRIRRRDADAALGRVGLGHRLDHRPHQLSGGEKQRVAIARALVSQAPLLLADEPTGALDSVSGAGVVALLREVNERGTSVVVITHDHTLADSLPRVVALRDGRIDTCAATPAEEVLP
ncbi:ABC transporter ATP-binding protein [Rathayibacter tritici]|uniref:ABC transporter ATP-binding protein n=1 Tax=Rathayibacter tritici TaxID=33888 RepID=A0A160KW77_9MICO|nr:ABC transporter ATP-binding protein [Rathayibacter tritici]AND18004.1 ABC transporter ATP-binding protein [Rathayibacter tritici]PPF23591.1 ABC transporter ATP-binding protein [Rathayibacter tritici]PPF69781.1 ABC transporter ATP-binding protein [Rathayibacter tritici]PPG09189.1 ABC transporter ATP-binding protein [Rathayibacter tritici]PPI18324.1 ABC transporter ATP-binding protein [Rathayibacter tritici]